MKLIGALLLIFCGASAGLSVCRSLHDAVRDAENCMRLSEELYTQICIRRFSLTEAVHRITGKRETAETSEPSEVWELFLLSQSVTGDRREAMRELGERLRGGDEPERAFSFCRDELKRCRERAESRMREKGRLCAALGISGGLFAAILLF